MWSWSQRREGRQEGSGSPGDEMSEEVDVLKACGRAREDRGWVVENGFFILKFGGFRGVIAHPGGPVGSGPIDGGSVGGNLGEAHPSRCRQVGG